MWRLCNVKSTKCPTWIWRWQFGVRVTLIFSSTMSQRKINILSTSNQRQMPAGDWLTHSLNYSLTHSQSLPYSCNWVSNLNCVGGSNICVRNVKQPFGLLSAVYLFKSSIAVYIYIHIFLVLGTQPQPLALTFATNCIHVVYSTWILL